jgi:hypothetical protein
LIEARSLGGIRQPHSHIQRDLTKLPVEELCGLVFRQSIGDHQRRQTDESQENGDPNKRGLPQ